MTKFKQEEYVYFDYQGRIRDSYQKVLRSIGGIYERGLVTSTDFPPSLLEWIRVASMSSRFRKVKDYAKENDNFLTRCLYQFVHWHETGLHTKEWQSFLRLLELASHSDSSLVEAANKLNAGLQCSNCHRNQCAELEKNETYLYCLFDTNIDIEDNAVGKLYAKHLKDRLEKLNELDASQNTAAHMNPTTRVNAVV